jgi:TetR/AcrR family transcriptional regulator, regulator of biofilm formation and stress response
VILEAALRILRDDGLAALTHRAVAREAGVSLALTSYHFATKENLISEALDLAVAETTDSLRAIAGELALADATPKMVADRLSDLMMGRLGDQRLAVVSVVELSLAAARRPQLRPANAAWNDAYQAIVVELLAGCGIRQTDQAARLVVATLEGLAFLQLIEADPRFEQRSLRPALRHLLRALAAAA